jgi:hypothetical protein
MSEAHAVVHIISSGSPTSLELPVKGATNWPSSSSLFSSVLKPLVSFTTSPRQEIVFLTRSHQRIMDRALRRSLRIIA